MGNIDIALGNWATHVHGVPGVQPGDTRNREMLCDMLMRLGGDSDVSAIIRRSRIMVLADDALGLVAETANRLTSKQILFPNPPATPLWLEFEESTIRHGDWSWYGVLLDRYEGDYYAHIFGTVPTPDGRRLPRKIEMKFWPGTHRWESAQNGICPNITCLVAQSNLLAHNQSDYGTPICAVDSEMGVDLEFGGLCACWAVNEEWMYLLSAFIFLLEARSGVIQDRNTRSIDMPQRPKKHVAGQRVKPTTTRETYHFVRVHLAAPQPQKVVAQTGGHFDVEDVGDDRQSWPVREVTIPQHPRLLIAGPGSRWLYTRVVYVDAHPRKIHVKNTTRFWVER